MATFDPLLIICQIISLQCFFYLAMGTLLGLFHAAFDIKVSLDYFFSPRLMNFISFTGWIDLLVALISAVAGAFLLSLIVEKAKKCVDFTCTLYFIHVIVCSFYYQQFPLHWEWWIVNVVASVMMASIGEYICARNELQDIPLYSPSHP